MSIPTTRIQNSPPAEPGFTLAEILIGAALVSIAVAGAATLLVSGTRLRARTEAADRHEALIDSDIALVQNLARRYNWCLGAADFSGANCNSVGPGREDYYFPANPANVTTFVAACTTTAGSPPRTTLINSLINQLPQTQLTATAGELVRAAAVPDGDAEAQRIRITYANQANTVTRVVTLVPPVANWCP